MARRRTLIKQVYADQNPLNPRHPCAIKNVTILYNLIFSEVSEDISQKLRDLN